MYDDIEDVFIDEQNRLSMIENNFNTTQLLYDGFLENCANQIIIKK